MNLGFWKDCLRREPQTDVVLWVNYKTNGSKQLEVG